MNDRGHSTVIPMIYFLIWFVIAAFITTFALDYTDLWIAEYDLAVMVFWFVLTVALMVLFAKASNYVYRSWQAHHGENEI